MTSIIQNAAPPSDIYDRVDGGTLSAYNARRNSHNAKGYRTRTMASPKEPNSHSSAPAANDRKNVRREVFLELFPEVLKNGTVDLAALHHALELPPPTTSDRLPSELIHALRNTAAVIQSSARLLERRCSLQPELSSIIEALMRAVGTLSGQLKS